MQQSSQTTNPANPENGKTQTAPSVTPKPTKPPKRLNVRLSVQRYDVWGNWRDGYDVNASYVVGECETDVACDVYGTHTLRSVLRKVRACGILLPYGLHEGMQATWETTIGLVTRTGKPWGEIRVEVVQ